MLKNLILFFSISLFSLQISAQDSENGNLLHDYNDVMWCGIDFSKSKMIGSEGFTNAYNVVDRFFGSWNNLILQESDKYNIVEFYEKKTRLIDLTVVKQRNEAVDPNKLVIDKTTIDPLTETDIQEVVDGYEEIEPGEGLGLLYIVEYFNKLENRALIHVVFFDTRSLEILWTEKYRTKPGGFGLRNYWARSILDTMEESGKDFTKSKK